MVGVCATGDGRWLPPGADMDEWRALVLLDEVPVARVRLPDPGAASEGFRRAAVDRHTDPQRAHRDLLERMERRLGVPQRAPARLTVSAVVCTHRRPLMLAGLLQAIGRLDPAPDEIVVVDNDPGELGVRDAARAAGVRYLREARRGLDHARATGLEAARGDLVAFIDDDCVPSASWLRALPELFDDPCVAAVTGPAFAHELDSGAKLAFEDTGGFGRGFHRRVHEWTNLSPPGASRAGAGANMILRRSAALSLEGLFPPELDAGTPTRSGGDLYALYRLLAAGHRVVYDPGTYVLHRHRPDMESMHETFRGYGTGIAAAVAKMLVEQRDLSALGALWWLVEQYVRAWRAPRGDVQREIARDYVEGALRGPRAWRASRKVAGGRWQVAGPPSESASESGSRRGLAGPVPPSATRDLRPAVSVIVTTHYRPTALARCLDSLRRQVDGTPSFEVIVANDAQVPLGAIDGVRVVETGGVGTGAARNVAAADARGQVLLFLDDDLVAEPDLVRRHSEAHDDGSERVAIGYCRPRPRQRNLASLGASAWWEDHYRALRDAAALTFMDILGGNMSVPRRTFERLGGFDRTLSRREDWEWGLRVLEAAIEVVYEPRARAIHEFAFGTRRALAASRRHGRCDAALIARRPDLAAALPARRSRRAMLRRPLTAALFLAAQWPLIRSSACVALDALELIKARPSWSRLFMLLHGAAYERGRRDGGDPRRRGAPLPVAEIELHSDDPIPPPAAVAPRVRLLAGGRPLMEFSSRGGHWGRTLAEQIAAAGYRETLKHVQAAPSPAPGVEIVGAQSWAARDARIRNSSAEVVVVALAGCPEDEGWAAQAAEALSAERVALAIGAGTDADGPPCPLTVHSRATDPERFPRIGRPPAYLAVRRDVYELLGGIDLRTASLGRHGAVLELCERALAAGWLVCRRDVPGLRSTQPERLERFARRAARAALMARRPAYTTAPASRPTAAASQRCAGLNSPTPAERPLTRSG
jgi:glycosyltransferase involved in cell wall biosynthesis